MATRSTLSEGDSPDSFSRYLVEIHKYSTLTPDQEMSLARHWVATRDPAAAEQLVTSHLGLIVKIAKGLRGYGLPLAELVGEGNVGMMLAIERFDPERGFRLSTYAIWWVRAAILEYILRSSSMVRLCTTPHQKRLFFKLRKVKTQLQAFEEGDLSPEMVARIATQLDVSEADVVTMNRRLSGPDQSLNAPVTIDGDDEWQDWLVDQSPDQETVLGDRQELDERRALLAQAMTQLSEREHYILSSRRLRERPLKLDELASHYGVVARAYPPDRGARLRQAAGGAGLGPAPAASPGPADLQPGHGPRRQRRLHAASCGLCHA